MTNLKLPRRGLPTDIPRTIKARSQTSKFRDNIEYIYV